MKQRRNTDFEKRRIKLKDGRYLIFYTFEDLPAPLAEKTDIQHGEPKPQAEDKRDV